MLRQMEMTLWLPEADSALSAAYEGPARRIA